LLNEKCYIIHFGVSGIKTENIVKHYVCVLKILITYTIKCNFFKTSTSVKLHEHKKYEKYFCKKNK